MSSDLESRERSPPLRPPPIKTKPSQTSEAGAIQPPESGDDECKTPTALENKIPPPLICPPAPKKPRTDVYCKRKMRHGELFQIVNEEELDALFRSFFALPDLVCCPPLKRRKS